jgi:hypothetical protein
MQFTVVHSECKMVLNSRLQNEGTVQEQILDSDSGVHISEDDISPQSDSDTEEDNRKDKDCRGWMTTAQSQHTVPVIHRGFRQNKAPHINKGVTTQQFQALFFLKLCNHWCKKQTDIITNT